MQLQSPPTYYASLLSCITMCVSLHITAVTHSLTSLVPRPFQAPDFDHLQYVKTEGESLGDLVMCTVV